MSNPFFLFCTKSPQRSQADTASRDMHPIHSCQQQPLLSSAECFCISVVFILPPSPLCIQAYRASAADWQNQAQAPARDVVIDIRETEESRGEFSPSLFDVPRARRWQRADFFFFFFSQKPTFAKGLYVYIRGFRNGNVLPAMLESVHRVFIPTSF